MNELKNRFIQINKNTWYIRLDWDSIMDYDEFYKIMVNCVNFNKDYHIICKVRYDNDKYIMLGNQMSFRFNVQEDIRKLYEVLDTQMGHRFDYYQINYLNLNYIILKFIEINKVLLSDIIYDKERVKNRNILFKKSTINIPILNEGSLLGDRLSVYRYNNIYKLALPNPYEHLIIKEDLYNDINNNTIKVYFRYTKPPHLLYIKNISNNIIEKSINTLDGIKAVCVTDEYKSNNELIRHENSSSKYIILNNNNEISSIIRKIKFKSITPKEFKYTYHQDLRIGVIDLETYYNTIENKTKVYCCGLRTFITDRCYIEYINDDLNSDLLIINLINEMLRPKYENIKFYCHNLGSYDAIFILKALYKYNENNNEKFLIDVLFNNNKALKIVIKKKNNKNNKLLKVTILDSYTILNHSLKYLAEKYEVDTLKTYFPYKFVNEKTLFYIGDTPERDLYESISIKEYNLYKSDSWDLKLETIKYIRNDLNSLYEVIKKFSRNIYKLFDIELTDSLTISSLSLQIFLKNYYNNNNLIPNIKNKKIYSDIKQGYYGGITEVYKPKGNNLYFYDVNSLYPFVSKNYMVGLKTIYSEYIKLEVNIDDLFGFYYAEIDNSNTNLYIGLLPYRDTDGLYFPIGKWNGWFFSEELKFAKENGYSIKIIKGYTFEKQKGIFDRYIEDIYKIKSSTKDSSERTLAKSLLNNLLGRFGMDITKPTTKIVNNEEYGQILLTSPLLNEIKISDDAFLVTYIPTLDTNMCKPFDIDPQKAFNKFGHLSSGEPDKSFNNVVSIPISAAISAYGRIHISKLKLDIINKGGHIYYSDTDSIVTDIELDNSLVSYNELGKLKLVDRIKEGYFISNKTYAYINWDNEIIKKSKGLDSKTLTYEDYIDMYNGKFIEDKKRKESIKNYSEGSVTITNNPIKLNPYSFKKRKKIYNNGLWVDTIPLKL